MKPHLKALLRSALFLKCGRCESGPLFKSYLKFHDHCPTCDLDYSITDTADGPAFFVGFIAMILFCPAFIMIAFLFSTTLAIIIAYIIISLLCLGFCLGLLPIFKAALFNLQIHHQAGACDFDSTGTHGTPSENWKKYLKTKK